MVDIWLQVSSLSTKWRVGVLVMHVPAPVVFSTPECIDSTLIAIMPNSIKSTSAPLNLLNHMMLTRSIRIDSITSLRCNLWSIKIHYTMNFRSIKIIIYHHDIGNLLIVFTLLLHSSLLGTLSYLAGRRIEFPIFFTLPYIVWSSIVIVHEKWEFFAFFSKYKKNSKTILIKKNWAKPLHSSLQKSLKEWTSKKWYFRKY